MRLGVFIKIFLGVKEALNITSRY